MTKLISILLFSFLYLITGCASSPHVKEVQETEEILYNKAMEAYRKKLFYECIPLFQNIKDKFPLSPYALQAELRIADSNYLLHNYLEALYQYEEFRKLHPANALIPYSIYQTGMCHFKQILTVDRDQTETEKALEEFEFLVSRFPQSPYAGLALSRIKICKRRIAEHEFIIGNYYLKNQNYRGAIDRFSSILEKYPYSIEKDKVLFHLGKAYLLTNNRSAAEKIFSNLNTQYPSSIYTREAKTLLGISIEKEKEKVRKEKENKKFHLF